MSRRHVLILLLAAVALTGFSYALSRRDSRDWRSNRARRLLPFPWQDTAAVAITRPDGETLRFSRRSGSEWQVELADGRTDALSGAATEDLAALATLTRRDPVPDRAPPDPGKAVSLVAANLAGQSVRLDFGDLQANVRAVTVDGDRSVVYGVSQDLLSFLDWPESRMRNMHITAGPGGAEPVRITLSPGGDAPSLVVTLVRGADGWRMTAPVDWPADRRKMELLLRWLERLQALSVVDEKPANLDAYGLEKPSGSIDIRYETPGGAVDRRVVFGGDTDSGDVYAMEKSRSPVFVIPRASLAEISMVAVEKHPALWRNFFRRRRVDLTDEKEPLRYRIERLLPEHRTLIISRKAGSPELPGLDEWEATLEDSTGVHRFPVDPPDPNRSDNPLGALRQALSNIRVKSFLSDAAADAASGEGDPAGPAIWKKWAARPAWRLSCQRADGSESPVLTLYAANDQGDLPSGQPYVTGDAEIQPLIPLAGYPDRAGLAFTLSNRPALLKTFADAAYRFCLPLYRYRSRHLLDRTARDLAVVEVLSENGSTVYFRRPDDENDQWWRSPASPEPLMDDNNRFALAVRELSQLTAAGFVSDGIGDLSEFGLDRPAITAIVYSSPVVAGGKPDADSRLFTLTLGNTAPQAGMRYAKLDGDGPVFLIAERLAAALGADYR